MVDPITSLADWLRATLLGLGLAPGLVTFLMALLGVVLLATTALVLDIGLVWLERKVVARFQDRLGPNRLGPFGLIQPVADVVKLLIKEDITPEGADRVPFNLAPIFALAAVLILWAIIPFAPTLVGSDLNVGVLYIVAAGALGTLGIIMAGWASNNKYALLGAMRTVAQMVSYEVPMVIALLVPVILARSMGINDIVHSQPVWYVIMAPLAALIFMISSIAELGRSPFDLNEAESEIVAGYHVEYTGMKFGLFYAGELLHAITISALFASLFLGGWRGPFVEQVPILGIIYLFIKALLVYFVIMWVRYSMPRIRIDHMLSFNWKFLTPLALTVLLVMAVLSKALEGAPLWLTVLLMFAANLLIGWIALYFVGRIARSERRRVAEPQPIASPTRAYAVPPSSTHTTGSVGD